MPKYGSPPLDIDELAAKLTKFLSSLRRNLVVTAAPIPKEQLQLGSLIVSLDEPQQGAHQAASAATGPDVLEPQPQKSYKGLVRSYKTTKLAPHLSVLGFRVSTELDDSVVVDSTIGLRYLLRDPLAWFKVLCASGDTQEWIMDRHRAKLSVYLVSGYFTFQNAKITIKNKDGKGIGFDANVPVGQIAAAAACGVPGIVPDSIGDVGIEYGRDAGKETELTYDAPGEQIYALQLKRIKISFWAKSSDSAIRLEGKCCWIDMLGNRSAGEEIVVADLDDALRLGKTIERVREKEEEGEQTDEYIVIQG